MGLLATALLLANNLRDIASDGEAGKRTVAVRVGRRHGGRLYAACVGLPFAGVAVWALLSVSGVLHSARPASALLPLVALPLALGPIRLVRSDAEGRALLPVLAATGRLQMAFGLLLAAGLWLWIPLPLLAGPRMTGRSAGRAQPGAPRSRWARTSPATASGSCRWGE